MQVVSGISWAQSDHTWRKVSVSLDMNDFVRMAVEGKIEDVAVEDGVVLRGGKHLPTNDIYKILQKQADRLVIYQMAKEGGISPEDAATQIQAL